MKKIADLLNKKKTSNVFSPDIDDKTIESVFLSILKKEMKNISRADIREAKLKNQKLFVKTIHPAVASEIWRRREKIVSEVNRELGREIIKEIRAV